MGFVQGKKSPAPRGGVKRPLWLTAVMFVVGFAIFAAQQKGWIQGSGGGGASSGGASTGSGSRAPTAPTSAPTSSAPASSAEARGSTGTTGRAEASPSTTPGRSAEGTSRAQTSQQAGTRTGPVGGGGKVSDGGISELFRKRQSDTWVETTGVVKKILPDDEHGDKHQRFIVRLGSSVEVLVAHNIDIADRVPVEEGDTIRFRGEYEWTEKGGTVHFTHAPKFRRREPGGWIEHEGAVYE